MNKWSICLTLILVASRSLAATGDLQLKRQQNVFRIMNDLNAGDQDTSMLEDVYTEDAKFIDPLVGEEGLTGLADLEKYHHRLNNMLTSMNIQITEYAIAGDTHMLYWKGQISMTVTIDLGKEFTRLSKLLPFINKKFSFDLDEMQYEGVSLFSFHPGDDRVAVHRDIYNEMYMYNKMPGIGPVLEAVKKTSRKNMLQTLN